MPAVQNAQAVYHARREIRVFRITHGIRLIFQRKRRTWTTLGRVWLVGSRYHDWHDRQRLIVERHEWTHSLQQLRHGPWRFGWRYLVSPAWRWAYETQAQCETIATMAWLGHSQGAIDREIQSFLRELKTLYRISGQDAKTRAAEVLWSEYSYWQKRGKPPRPRITAVQPADPTK